MTEQNYVLFSLKDKFYAINTANVGEVFSIPELEPLPGAPAGMIGTVNLRGEILPIIDITTKQGQQFLGYRLTDSIVIIKGKQGQIGLIINGVHGVKSLSPEEINYQQIASEELAEVQHKEIIAGFVKDERNTLIINELENWSSYQAIQEFMSVETSSIAVQGKDNQALRLFPNATSEERTILRQRADNLRRTVEKPDLTDLMPLAVIALNDGFFGIDLGIVQEFTNISKVTPVPCCPSHIVGNINLRGEILTLVDIRSFLNLPLIDISREPKVMVVEVEGIVAGVVVEEVYDTMFMVNPQEIKSLSSTSNYINQEYIQGIAPYQRATMNILDLPKIFVQGGLIIDQVI
ncbi:MAG: chemotaxis protein CheW [Coleofasciculaceae cyanobacterium]